MSKIEIKPTKLNDDYLRSHVLLWGGMAALILAGKKCINKSEFFDQLNISNVRRPENLCYACEEANDRLYSAIDDNLISLNDDISKCEFCPLGKDFCKIDGLYYKWQMFTQHNNWEEAFEYAKKIRDAKWR